jgi:hypothetical protein
LNPRQPAGQVHWPLRALQVPTCSSSGQDSGGWRQRQRASYAAKYTAAVHVAHASRTGQSNTTLLTNLVAVQTASLVAPGCRHGWRWQLCMVIDTPCAKCPFAPPLDCFRQLWLCLLLLLLLCCRRTLRGSLFNSVIIGLQACRPLRGLQEAREGRQRWRRQAGCGRQDVAAVAGQPLVPARASLYIPPRAPTFPAVPPRGSQASFIVPSSSKPSTRMARSTAATRFAGLRAAGRRSAIRE